MRLRAATLGDAAAIAEIYAPYVRASAVSFETEAPDATAIDARMAAAGDAYPWLVAVDGAGAVLGYAYASAFRPRPAYRYAVETTVYVAQAAQRRGVGGALYRALIPILEAQHYVQAIVAITLPNAASVALHEGLGFTPAGIYRQVGYKQGGWHDVGLWQRALAPMAVPPTEPLALSALSGLPGL